MIISSFIGFALMMLCVSIASSVLLTGVVLLTRSRLRVLGPWAERRASMSALLLPPLLGSGVTAILGTYSALALASGTDHCMAHPHHLHLCWVHGTGWVTSPLAVGSLGFLLTFTLARVAGILVMHAQARSTVAKLLSLGKPIEGIPRVFLVPESEHFAFTAGIINPVILVSKTGWDELDEVEQRALIAHERTHIAHGDIWKRTALAILSAFGAPVLSRSTLEIFENASERLCDRNAARLVGKPSSVAGAILTFAASRTRHPMPAATAHAASCEVTDRIHSLFENGLSGRPVAKHLGWFLIAVCIVAIAIGVLFADSLHHLLETILG